MVLISIAAKENSNKIYIAEVDSLHFILFSLTRYLQFHSNISLKILHWDVCKLLKEILYMKQISNDLKIKINDKVLEILRRN